MFERDGDDTGGSNGTSGRLYFVLGSVAMLAVIGLVLLVVSRRVKGAGSPAATSS